MLDDQIVLGIDGDLYVVATVTCVCVAIARLSGSVSEIWLPPSGPVALVYCLTQSCTSDFGPAMLCVMWASSTALAITAEDKAELERIVRSGRTEQRHALRARIILGAAEGRE